MKTNNPTLRGYASIALFSSALLLSGSAGAQGSKESSINARLEEVSHQMAAENNNHFLIVEAVRDGVIVPGRSYDFRFDGKAFTIDGKALPKAINQRYVAMWNGLVEKDEERRGETFGMKSDSVTLKEIFDVNSRFRKGKGNRVQLQLIEGKNYSIRQCADGHIKPLDFNNSYAPQLIREMAGDGLVDPTTTIRISYSKGGLYVNNVKLSGLLDAKYKRRFKALSDVDPADGTSTIDIVSEPDRHAEKVGEKKDK